MKITAYVFFALSALSFLGGVSALIEFFKKGKTRGDESYQESNAKAETFGQIAGVTIVLPFALFVVGCGFLMFAN